MPERSVKEQTLAQRVGARVKHLRNLAGWSQGKLGERLGLAASSVSDMERGKTDMGLNKLELMCEIFDKPVSFFTDKAISHDPGAAQSNHTDPSSDSVGSNEIASKT